MTSPVTTVWYFDPVAIPWHLEQLYLLPRVQNEQCFRRKFVSLPLQAGLEKDFHDGRTPQEKQNGGPHLGHAKLTRMRIPLVHLPHILIDFDIITEEASSIFLADFSPYLTLYCANAKLLQWQ